MRKSSQKRGPKAAKTIRKTVRRPRKLDQEIRGLTALAEGVFGKQIIDDVKQRGITVRELWELSSPTVQCNAIIGPYTLRKTPCWICGLPIQKISGLTAECEHILPVAQAVMYLRLYSGRTGIQESMRYEYDWAHVVCNQEKSDSSPLYYTATSEFAINRDEIKRILRNIYTSHRQDSGAIKNQLLYTFRTIDSFIADRIDKVQEKYSRIIDFINTPGAVDDPLRPYAAKLITLAGISGMSDLDNLKPEVHELLNPAAVQNLLAETRKTLEIGSSELLHGQTMDHIIATTRMYDTIQQEVLRTLAPFSQAVSLQPVYADYFSAAGIVQSKSAESLNPDTYQAHIFQCIVDAYPKLYIILGEARKTTEQMRIHAEIQELLSSFISFRILSDIRAKIQNISDTAPRTFQQTLDNLVKQLEGKLRETPGIFEVLQEEYDVFSRDEAAAALVELQEAF